MPRWSAERRAPSVIGRGTPRHGVSACRVMARFKVRRSAPAPFGALPPRSCEGFLSTAPPVRRKAEAGQRAAQRWLRRRSVGYVDVERRAGCECEQITARCICSAVISRERGTERSGVMRGRPGPHVPRHYAIGTTGGTWIPALATLGRDDSRVWNDRRVWDRSRGSNRPTESATRHPPVMFGREDIFHHCPLSLRQPIEGAAWLTAAKLL
jgi:hypothetical protein